MRISDWSSDVCSSDLTKRFLGHRIYVDSCGVRRGRPDPFMVETMAEIGIDMGPHRPKGFDELEDGFFDLIVSLSPEAQHRSIELTRTRSEKHTSELQSLKRTASDGIYL